MNTIVYLSCQLIIISLVIGLAGAITFVCHKVFSKIAPIQSTLYVRYIQLAILFWLLILAALSLEDFGRILNPIIKHPITISFIPILLILFLSINPSFNRLLRLVPCAWLIRIQGFRILLELTFWLGYKGSFVPIQITFEWLNQDIIVGITALFAASLFFGKKRFLKREAIIWNIFGILLLFNYFIVAIYSFPSQFQVFKTSPDSSFLMDIPFIWIPGFLIPFALAMHIFSLKQVFMFNPSLSKRKFGSRM